MGRLTKFVALSPAERRLLVGAASLLATVRLALWVLPFGWAHRALSTFGIRRRSPRGDALPVERIVWAVSAAARLVPGATCLVRALAAQILLARRGHASQLRLGAAGGLGRPFEAHAWIERDGQVLIGGPVDARYVPFPALDPRR
jgi:Transglutaminase-like superfamily